MADLIAIVPAKASSTRVPLKNYREFHNGRSLVDLTIYKLLAAGMDRYRIFLSCEDRNIGFPVAIKHGINFSPRSAELCPNDVPMPDYIRGVVRDVGKYFVDEHTSADDVLWAQVTDPLFDDYSALLDKWQRFGQDYDSAVVVHPRRKYLLDANHQPLGFGFGPWHVKSQRLPFHYELPFTASILTRRSIERTGYFVGADPLWFESPGPSVDIDTEEDFELARQLYALRHP
jgi:CMP-N-acetylneuraminic acid synthetase